jgi:hypothetical protein
MYNVKANHGVGEIVEIGKYKIFKGKIKKRMS